MQTPPADFIETLLRDQKTQYAAMVLVSTAILAVKFSMWCLCVFITLCSIVSVSAANIINGQVDTTCVLLWLEIEACVTVMMVSVTAFRTMFTDRAKPPAEKRRLQEHQYSSSTSPTGVANTRFSEEEQTSLGVPIRAYTERSMMAGLVLRGLEKTSLASFV